MLKRFSLELYNPGDCLMTRDGREVATLKVVKDITRHLFPIVVEVRVPHTGGVVSYEVNQNGRRWMNTRSEDDIFFATNVRRRGGSDDDGRKLDCMPEPLRAIEGVRKGKLTQVVSANKYEKAYNTGQATRSVVIDPYAQSKYE